MIVSVVIRVIIVDRSHTFIWIIYDIATWVVQHHAMQVHVEGRRFRRRRILHRWRCGWTALYTELFYCGNFHSWWFEILLFFQQFLLLYKVNVFVSSHTGSSIVLLPWCICNLLHLEKYVWLLLIFNVWLFQHLLNVLIIVFFWIHKPNVLLQFLLESLWEAARCLIVYINCF